MKTTQGHSDKLISPIFSPGILLDAADLQQGVIYTQELMHLMMRHLFSPGVVCGLEIGEKTGGQGCSGKYTFTVQPGLALDDCGRPIHVPKEISVEAELSSNSTYGIFIKYQSSASCHKEAYAKSDGTSESVATRKKEGYEISVEQISTQVTSGKTKDCDTSVDCMGIKIGEIAIKNDQWVLTTKPDLVCTKFSPTASDKIDTSSNAKNELEAVPVSQ